MWPAPFSPLLCLQPVTLCSLRPQPKAFSLIIRPEAPPPLTQQDVPGFDSRSSPAIPGPPCLLPGWRGGHTPLPPDLLCPPLALPALACFHSPTLTPSTVVANVAPSGMILKEGKEGSPRIWRKCSQKAASVYLQEDPSHHQAPERKWSSAWKKHPPPAGIGDPRTSGPQSCSGLGSLVPGLPSLMGDLGNVHSPAEFMPSNKYGLTSGRA